MVLRRKIRRLALIETFVARPLPRPNVNTTTRLCLGRAVDAAAISHARVPELTASAGIKLTERHSLRRCKNRIG
jgi:hypothetical protein